MISFKCQVLFKTPIETNEKKGIIQPKPCLYIDTNFVHKDIIKISNFLEKVGS